MIRYSGVHDFTVWKTIKLGLLKSPQSYEEALEKDGYRIADYTGQILQKTEVSQAEVDLDLVVVTVGGLGFKCARRGAVCARAIELGLQLCPAEVGPALRLLYKDQPRGEELCIEMSPIIHSIGRPFLFGIIHTRGVRWLGSCYGGVDRTLEADNQRVFVRPRK